MSGISGVAGRIADVLLVGFLALMIWSYPQLPEQVVSHFGPDGPDGWMPRGWFTVLFVGTVLGFEALFRWGIPAMMRRTPPSLVNIPHKTFWMSTPERQALAYEKVLEVIGPSRLFMNAVMSVALYVCVHASGVPLPWTLPISWMGVFVGGGSLVFTVAVFIWAFRTFRPPVGRERV